MTSVTRAIRFMHIWPYKSFDERARLWGKAVAARLWPPPGGPSYLVSQQVDIYLPAPFSPMRCAFGYDKGLFAVPSLPTVAQA